MVPTAKLLHSEGARFHRSAKQELLVEESHPSGRRFNLAAGGIAGLVGIGCCVYPVGLALLGLATATEAVAIGLRLYGTWGWAFKIGGVALGGTAFLVQRQRAAACRIAMSPARSFLTIGIVAVAVYFLVYAATSFLARIV